VAGILKENCPATWVCSHDWENSWEPAASIQGVFSNFFHIEEEVAFYGSADKQQHPIRIFFFLRVK